MSEPTPITYENVAEACAEALGAASVIVIPVMRDDSIIVCTTPNLNHAASVRHLAVAIHAVLSNHDQAVLAGKAGEEARDLFERMGYGDR